MAHTPGPWENHKWNSEEHQISAKGGTIALVSHDHSLVPEDEADANARLIAAAPDLLEACHNAIEAYHILAITDISLRLPGFEDCLAALNAAIAKAEGRSA